MQNPEVSKQESRKLILSSKQLDYIKNSNHSYNIQSGVTKSGKTFSQILRWQHHIYKGAPEGSLLLMTGRTSESLYDNVIRPLLKLDVYSDMRYRSNPGKIFVRSRNIEIACIGCDKKESWGRIQGKGVYGWLGDEVVQHPKEVIDIGIAVTSAEGKIWPKFWSCNPDSKTHYVKKQFIDSKTIDVANWYFGFYDNPTITPELIKEFENSFTGVFKERMFYGRWVSAEGSIYDKFDRGEHVKTSRDEIPWNAIDHYVVGIDWGYGDGHQMAILLFAVESDGTYYQIDEYVADHQLVDVSLKKRLEDKGWYDLDLFRWDGTKYQNQKTKPYESWADSARPDLIATWNELMGYPCYGAIKDSKEAMIHAVQLLYAKGANGKYGIYYLDGMCSQTLSDKESYRWRKTATGKDEPLKENDHTQDAEQYVIYSRSKKMDFSGLGNLSFKQRDI